MAAAFQSLETIELLIKKGADIHAKDNKGQGPIFYSLNIETTKLFIAKGAGINSKNKEGKSLLRAYVESENPLLDLQKKKEFVLLFLKNGAEIDSEIMRNPLIQEAQAALKALSNPKKGFLSRLPKLSLNTIKSIAVPSVIDSKTPKMKSSIFSRMFVSKKSNKEK